MLTLVRMAGTNTRLQRKNQESQMPRTRASLTARRFIDELKSSGIIHAVWLPDSEANFLHEAMITGPDLQVAPVCREGESFAIASGLNIGGKTAAVLVQNIGLSTWLMRRRQCQAAEKPLSLLRPSRSRSARRDGYGNNPGKEVTQDRTKVSAIHCDIHAGLPPSPFPQATGDPDQR